MQIKLIIDRFEGDKVVLKTEDNITIIWPKNKLPENIHEGMALEFLINRNENKEKDNKNLAKDILNEILNPDK